MFGSSKRADVNRVFTPRRMDVNPEIYVPRTELETALRRAIAGAMHVVIYGESGSGKSWLYKKVLSELGAIAFSANSSNALRLESLTKVICDTSGVSERMRLTGASSKMDAGLNVGVAKADLGAIREYTVDGADPLLAAFAEMRKRAGSAPAVLVVDNLELILSSDALMNELASLVTLLDDPTYAVHQIKLLLVGVPSVVRDYFSKTPATQSVANRLQEVSEVSALSKAQVGSLVTTGFRKLLKVDVPDEIMSQWQEHIYTVTMGYAQAVQEYCEQLGYVLEDSDWKATAQQLAQTDEAWLKSGLSAAEGAIAARMNERETTRGRRNQVLYALGKVNHRSFTVQDVETIVRKEFPGSTADITLAIGQLLGELSRGVDPIIKPALRGAEYEFRDARRAMALRVLLQKEPIKERVRRITDPR